MKLILEFLLLNIAFVDIDLELKRGNILFIPAFNTHYLDLLFTTSRLLPKRHHWQKVYGADTAYDAIMHYL